MASDPVFGLALALLQFLGSTLYQLTCLSLALGLGGLVLLLLLGTFLGLKFRVLGLKSQPINPDHVTIGFFHPYCNAGGGGERVLWVAIRALQKRFPVAKFLVYTGDLDAAPDQIISQACQRFNIPGLNPESIEFVYLHRRAWVEAVNWPMFTLFGQSLGSLSLGLEALDKAVPDIFLDTMGYAFTLPLFKYFGGCKVGCYVHYPTISTDMLGQVQARQVSHNNRQYIAKSRMASSGKVLYYRMFSWLYGWAGRQSDVVMVNSSWTEEHINDIWQANHVQRVYPPCDIDVFRQIPRRSNPDGIQTLVSLGQFRPEKDHPLQIRSMAKIRDKLLRREDRSNEENEKAWEKLKLVLIGGCRNDEDEARVQDLKDLCKHLAVDENVEFKVNLPYDKLKEEMGQGLIGLHTMWNEHFGIAVVEMLASGLITLAHRSGGPLMDIVNESPDSARNGFLAIHEAEYAETVLSILEMNESETDSIRERAKSSVQRFSEAQFESAFIRATETVISSCVKQ
ncbi:hypothetical protein TCAL_12485 [Tigriopus californicus]|uniref:GDP-Man:Man(3)GlcNAc(2)-PP-Dol alpha-1,2-mannosyltransferase n=1 Tax=Tigriopus californicus TaxID=6832 RepID=A0A553P7I1_TIGCA|nr:GDP-Man:Man(3)GlcNAc(2)-PP-Dol alpha-1,2-mannosyltransferase-like [Tigriopus californicus]XP_059079985.1 GDP-Man:Man(3)GlcNAc(2)-PP-Dol alpha-1,2-mannosyltransferase-like [Tigriopus californicus]TRY73648.1 hypothetical protein TCAL_12485 [Tigriopus californicus]